MILDSGRGLGSGGGWPLGTGPGFFVFILFRYVGMVALEFASPSEVGVVLRLALVTELDLNGRPP